MGGVTTRAGVAAVTRVALGRRCRAALGVVFVRAMLVSLDRVLDVLALVRTGDSIHYNEPDLAADPAAKKREHGRQLAVRIRHRDLVIAVRRDLVGTIAT
jgi:hypothetical protein